MLFPMLSHALKNYWQNVLPVLLCLTIMLLEPVYIKALKWTGKLFNLWLYCKDFPNYVNYSLDWRKYLNIARLPSIQRLLPCKGWSINYSAVYLAVSNPLQNYTSQCPLNTLSCRWLNSMNWKCSLAFLIISIDLKQQQQFATQVLQFFLFHTTLEKKYSSLSY